MQWLARLLGNVLKALAESVAQLVLTLVAVIVAVASMGLAAYWFGTTGLLVVAVPLIAGIAIWSYNNAGSDGDSDSSD